MDQTFFCIKKKMTKKVFCMSTSRNWKFSNKQTNKKLVGGQIGKFRGKENCKKEMEKKKYGGGEENWDTLGKREFGKRKIGEKGNWCKWKPGNRTIGKWNIGERDIRQKGILGKRLIGWRTLKTGSEMVKMVSHIFTYHIVKLKTKGQETPHKSTRREGTTGLK